MVTKPKASFSGDSGDSRTPGPCSKGQSERPAASSVRSHCIYRTACSWSRGSGRKLESGRPDLFRPLITSRTGPTQPGLFCFVFLFSRQVRQRHTCAQWNLNRMCWAAKCHLYPKGHQKLNPSTEEGQGQIPEPHILQLHHHL